MSKEDSPTFTRDLLISIALFILGDKIVVISRLILISYDNLLNGGESKSPFVLEFSLIAIAVGISAVTWISAILKKENAQTVITGAIVSSIAGFISISEAAFFPENESIYGNTPSKAFFFFGIYISLFILPTFIFRATSKRLDFSPMLLASIGIVVGALVGVAMRFSIMELAWQLPLFVDHNERSNVLDEMRFRPDSLIFLGTVWSLVVFQPHIIRNYERYRIKPILWAICYTFAAGASGYLYSATLEYQQGENGYSYEFFAIGFALIAVAPSLLSMPYSKILGQNLKIGLQNGFICFIGTSVVAFLTLNRTVEVSQLERLFIALCFGACGATISIATHSAACIYNRIRQTDQPPIFPTDASS